MQTAPILSIRNLAKRFGGLVAVDDMSLDVFPGEVVALLGDNGAGKSTVIKCVSGVYRANAGQIIFNGESREFQPPDRSARTGDRDDLPRSGAGQ